MIYILSKKDLRIKDIIQTINYTITQNIDLTGKSIFEVDRVPNTKEGDFLIQKDSNYKGIVTNVETEKDTAVYKIHCDEIDNIFNRKVILKNEELISTIGIEDFIKKTIEDNFTQSNDTFLNIPYISLEVLTHTKISASVETEEGIYNFRTYLGNVKEKYDIFLNYEFSEGRLNISIYRCAEDALQIDATLEDVIMYQEMYNVNVIAKVSVLSKETGNIFNYFLLTDRTTTTDKNHPNRAKGEIEVVTCENDSEAQQTALDVFRQNRYQHNIELDLVRGSKLNDINDFVVGRQLRIKTKDTIYETFISKIEKSKNSNIYKVTCGNMKVTLLDKLKEVVER